MNEIDQIELYPTSEITKRVISKITKGEKELLNSIEPSSLLELYQKYNVKVSISFIVRGSTKELYIDMHSIEYRDFVKYDSTKSNLIQTLESLPQDRSYHWIHLPIIYDIKLVTYVDNILETRRNGYLYLLRVIKDKKEYILEVDECLE